MKYNEVESGSGTKETTHFDKETSEIYQYEGRVLGNGRPAGTRATFLKRKVLIMHTRVDFLKRQYDRPRPTDNANPCI